MAMDHKSQPHQDPRSINVGCDCFIQWIYLFIEINNNNTRQSVGNNQGEIGIDGLEMYYTISTVMISISRVFSIHTQIKLWMLYAVRKTFHFRLIFFSLNIFFNGFPWSTSIDSIQAISKSFSVPIILSYASLRVTMTFDAVYLHAYCLITNVVRTKMKRTFNNSRIDCIIH